MLNLNGQKFRSVVGGEVDAEDGGDGGGDLLSVVKAAFCGLAQCRNAFSQEHEPCDFGAFGAAAVVGPFACKAAAVVAGDEVGCLTAIELVGFQGLVDVADEGIGAFGGIEV